MRGRSGEWGAPPWGGGRRGPARHIGAGIFGFLFFLFVMSAIVGGLIAWVLAPGRGWFLLVGFVVIVAFAGMMRGLFRRTWAPISALIDATTRLGDGDTSVRMADSRAPGMPSRRHSTRWRIDSKPRTSAGGDCWRTSVTSCAPH